MLMSQFHVATITVYFTYYTPNTAFIWALYYSRSEKNCSKCFSRKLNCFL